MRPKKAFTLVEMLAVIFIIGLLVAIIMPMLSRAKELANRSACANNVREVVKACMLYAVSTSEQGDTPKALPVAGGKAPNDINKDNWFHFDNGNRSCLWLLVTGQYTTPDSFVCPSAKFHAAKASDDQFGESTCAYSYISMVNPTASDRPPIGMTDLKSIAGLVILADLNTRFVPGSSAFDPLPDGYFGTNRNSQIHTKGEGQNIGRIDGSATWNDTGKVTTGLHSDDGIYESNTPGSDSEGKARAADDVFLLP